MHYQVFKDIAFNIVLDREVNGIWKLPEMLEL